ncbi:MAG: 6,7-dimethyl-8-ribityllumazine synthase [Candidatus Aenigmarchaeota archaeon]|nr:6,7-dimethyl-8-ribityllumazine synthase [Candidatus Aenigmarchaeota archaeon]
MSNKIAVVLGSFHKKEAEIMLQEARKVAKENSLEITQEVWVPGSMEKPLAVKRILKSGKVDGIAVLGIIERGETKHGLVMGHSVISALIDLQLEFMKPIGIGILGPEILPDQIQPRLKPYAKGAVLAVKEMLQQGR